MVHYFFYILHQLDSFFWGYIGFSIVMVLGLYLSVVTNFFQLRAFPSVLKTFVYFLFHSSSEKNGTHPLKVFFASVGGMIGIGNIVGIVTAVQFGGPGALFWVWIAALIGSLIKYSEIYLGLKFREANSHGGFDGGPMFFLKKAFSSKVLITVVCLLLCVYGVEPYQFAVICDSLSLNWGLDRHVVIATLLFLVLWAGNGGVKRIGSICAWIIPFFILLYVSMSLWVLLHYLDQIPQLIGQIVHSAFNGHAAVGGFAGSSIMLAIQNGMAAQAYSADIGTGYDSIIQSESKTAFPERQARLAVLGVSIDCMICTMSILLVLVTGVWHKVEIWEASQQVQAALSLHFPWMDIFMPLFLFILGYTTLISYFCMGLKCAKFLHPSLGTKLYFCYAIFVLVFFSFFDQTKALLLMRIAGGSLLVINLLGIFILRKYINFTLQEEPKIPREPKEKELELAKS